MSYDSDFSPESVLSARHVSKKFCRSLKRSMYYGTVDMAKGLVGVRQDTSWLREGEFWAVNDVNLQLRKGDALGIVGVNGSGKTTLLRLLTGILPPDRGEIMTRGRIGALISLGAGFHPYMSGRDNIYLNGVLLGMNRREIDSKLDWIIDFSELAGFIDSPVSTYSSGMRVRLGFSIAVAVRPDILILDEVLAVGDRKFKSKCFNEMDRLAGEAAIVLVSHQLKKIAKMCNGIMVMDQGSVVYEGSNVTGGISFYCSRFAVENSSVTGSGRAELHGVRLFTGREPDRPQDRFTLEYLDDLILEVAFSIAPGIDAALMNVMLYDMEHHPVFSSHSDDSGFEIRNTGQRQAVRLRIPRLPLSPGQYSLTLLIRGAGKEGVLVKHNTVCSFRVVGQFTTPSPFHLMAEWSHLPSSTSWALDKAEWADEEDEPDEEADE